ncbi:myrosinase 1-like [Adelges cooleyi]|uniref:myrosinase 1-like n=1 Tax=Adelges cooleyi TaxID=133065 RepID=UPI0021803B62|nr:myrosinase 1-like [Adelges cooleyi]
MTTAVDFPKDFLFGTSSSAYQIEGAVNEGVSGERRFHLCVKDVFIKKQKYSDVFSVRSAKDIPKEYINRVKLVGYSKGSIIFKVVDKIVDKLTSVADADIACDSYHKTDVDVALLKELGVQVYRFSLSWSRILPTGYDHEPNGEAIQHYQDFIDKLLANNIQPLVTMYHCDLPQVLQEAGGWTNNFMIGCFSSYARFLFKTFGDKVKLWTTINEPRLVSEGYGGIYGLAPFDHDLGATYSGIGDYLSIHNMLLAHAVAYRIYEKDFKPTQNGGVSICPDTTWAFPNDGNNENDKKASELVLQHYVGMFIEPLVTGEFPKIVLESIKDTNERKKFSTWRLVPFTDEEKKLLIGAYDFMAFNYYRALRVTMMSEDKIKDETDLKKIDQRIEIVGDYADPSIPIDDYNGFYNILTWLSKKCKKDTKFIICENGLKDIDNPLITAEVKTKSKIEYHRGILVELSKAIKDGINVFGYCVWSFMDSYEWIMGYKDKFGIYEVDFENPDRPRTKKGCFNFFNKLFQDKKLPVDST